MKGLFTFLFITLFIGLYAQNEYNRVYEDFGVWSAIEVSRNGAKRLSHSLEIGYRVRENATQLNQVLLEYTLEKDLKKKWLVGMKLRTSWNGEAIQLRSSPYFIKEFRLKPFNINWRTQSDFRYYSDDKWEPRLRNRIGISYSKKKYKLTPSIQLEYFHDYDKLWYAANDVRGRLDLSYKRNKRWSFKIGYLIQQQVNRSRPDRDYVVTFKSKYSFK